MSGLETNKIAGAVLTAGVTAWTIMFVTNHLLIHKPVVVENAYPIEIAEVTSTSAAAATVPEIDSIVPMMASAEVEAGIKVAKKCTACHSFDEGGPNKIGPNLYGIMGRSVAAGDGFAYSGALQEKSSETWDYETMNAFLAKPKDWAPGTKMTFAGLKKTGDRANVVAYLRSLAGSPIPLP